MNALNQILPADIAVLCYDYTGRDEGSGLLEHHRRLLNHQLMFCLGRENGEFLGRMMKYNHSMYPREDWDYVGELCLTGRISGGAGDKIQVFNDEYLTNCCRVCRYYVFDSGCEYCGISRSGHNLNVTNDAEK